jgi:N-acetylneuraminic acid mutarotase
MRTATLFALFVAQAHANSTLTAHRKLQGGCGDVFSRVSQVNAACCPSGGAGGEHRRTQTCSPTTCSSLCATVFVPFLDDCASNLQAAGQDLTQFFGLYFSCRQLVPGCSCPAEPQKIYALGGYDGSSRLNTAEAYDPSTNTWTAIAPMGTARSALAATTLNGKIYALGGWDGYRLNIAEAYDLRTNTWTAIASMGTRRNYLAAATLNGQIYALGGWDGGSSRLNTAEAYNPRTNTWTAIAPMGTRRYRLAAPTLNGKIYALGGYDGSSYFNIAEAYDPTTNTWTAIAPMGTVRSALAAATL